MYRSVKEMVDSVLSLKEVREVIEVLSLLEASGLEQAAVASGYTRGLLTEIQPSDIDISYVGDIHYKKAQEILRLVIKKIGYEDRDWDIDGIWNVTMAYKGFNTVEQNYLAYYVDSIDSVYLRSDGALIDPTGYGFNDALTKTLRMNAIINNGHQYDNTEIVYL